VGWLGLERLEGEKLEENLNKRLEKPPFSLAIGKGKGLTQSQPSPSITRLLTLHVAICRLKRKKGKERERVLGNRLSEAKDDL
jgi:hypothetical protein